MLNPKTNQRELAYIVTVDEVKELEGYDNVHYIRINEWWCVAPKSLKKGDLAVYFEIDSLLPKDDTRFSFMEKKNWRVKTQRMCKVLSQGLVMPLNEFPELKKQKLGDFVTDKLKVTLYEDNQLKDMPRAKVDAFSKTKDRHKKFFNFPLVKWMMRFCWFRWLCKKMFIKKKDKIAWPIWLPKTNQERIQNLPNLFSGEKTKWIITEKIDGMSSSYFLDEKDNYFVGSHNIIVYSSLDKDAEKVTDGSKYVNSNVWVEMSDKYKLRDILTKIKEEYKLKTIAIQGEVYGDGIQKRNYSLKNNEHDFAVFHILFNGVRVSIEKLVEICKKYALPFVNIFDWDYEIPESIEKIIEDVNSKKSAIDGKEIEGFVFYSKSGLVSFKCVSPEFLLKYHS